MTEQHAILFYDGHCNLCHSMVRFVVKRDKKGVIFLAPLQGETAERRLSREMVDADTVVLMDGGQVYLKSQAVFRVLKKMGFPYSIGAVFGVLPGKLCDWGYDIIARNRYRWWGRKEICEMPSRTDLARFLP